MLENFNYEPNKETEISSDITGVLGVKKRHSIKVKIKVKSNIHLHIAVQYAVFPFEVQV